MKWSIQQLYAKRVRGLVVDDEVNVDELKERDSEIRDISPAKVSGRAEFSADGLVTFFLRISGEMTLPCARSLADVRYSFETETEEMFQIDGYKDTEDEEIREPENGFVDLLPAVKESILLSIPIQVFADEEEQKKGPAPLEGENWSLISEEEASEETEKEADTVDPRLKDLSKFFDK